MKPKEMLRAQALEVLQELDLPNSGVIVCDRSLKELYASIFERAQLPIFAIDACEQNKSLATVENMYRFFMKHFVNRAQPVHVFGGGICCDLAAYAASTYKRGIRLILYPSTLLAMIDAAIGGKTAVNFASQKNLIGTFYPAESIRLYPPFLNTLPHEELRQGLAEMLKAHILFPRLPLPDFSATELPDSELLISYALFKMSICQQDPYDTEQRRLLNFGHSFAHALESLSKYEIKHGDAVALGMNMACDFSLEMGLIELSRHEELNELLSLYPYPSPALDFAAKISFEELLPLLRQDKKNSGAITLILPVKEEIKQVELKL
jgi:3-dehydroquinate synthase